jgi:hypothetical protein
MKIRIPYGKEKVEVEVEENRIAGIVEPNVVSVGDETKTIRKGIEQPTNSRSFSPVLEICFSLLMITPDLLLRQKY